MQPEKSGCKILKLVGIRPSPSRIGAVQNLIQIPDSILTWRSRSLVSSPLVSQTSLFTLHSSLFSPFLFSPIFSSSQSRPRPHVSNSNSLPILAHPHFSTSQAPHDLDHHLRLQNPCAHCQCVCICVLHPGSGPTPRFSATLPPVEYPEGVKNSR